MMPAPLEAALLAILKRGLQPLPAVPTVPHVSPPEISYSPVLREENTVTPPSTRSVTPVGIVIGWIRNALFAPDVCSSTACPTVQLFNADCNRVVSNVVSDVGSPFVIACCACSVLHVGGKVGSTTVRVSCPCAKAANIAARTPSTATLISHLNRILLSLGRPARQAILCSSSSQRCYYLVPYCVIVTVAVSFGVTVAPPFTAFAVTTTEYVPVGEDDAELLPQPMSAINPLII